MYEFTTDSLFSFCTDFEQYTEADLLEKVPVIVILSSNKYEGFCFGCFMNEYPDSIIVRNYRNKEFINWLSNKFHL